MQRVWYRQDQAAVLRALQQGKPPDLATTLASGPLDELVGLHEQLGIFGRWLWSDRGRGKLSTRLICDVSVPHWNSARIARAFWG